MSLGLHQSALTRQLAIATALLAGACGSEGVPAHGLGTSSVGKPGTLGSASGGGGDAAPSDAAPPQRRDEPDIDGPPAPVPSELPYAEGDALKVAADTPAASGAYGPYYVAFEVAGNDEVVRSSKAGTVTAVNDSYVNGGPSPDLVVFTNTVIVESPDGVRTEYLHLQPGSALIAVGQLIAPGVALAYAGNTGYVSGRRIGLRASRSGVPAPLCFHTPDGVCEPAEPGVTLESLNEAH